MPLRPIFNKSQIRSLESLAAALTTDLGVLGKIADNIEKQYSPFSIPKKNSTSFRTINIPSLNLKLLQKKINKQIFENVTYPDYLFGGLKEKDYVKNAVAHTNAHAVITLDIKNFYPSIKTQEVINLFKYFFKFSPEVSDILAKLCCLGGGLPQGACTSSYIANLIFHDKEYHLVQNFINRGYCYTRLLDDISISNSALFSEKEVDHIITSTSRMIREKGLKLNNKKTKATTKSNPHMLMEITGLWLNRGKPRVKPIERESIRLEVFNCIQASKLDRTSIKQYHEQFNRVSGLVSKLAYLDYKESKRYRDELRKVLPLYTPYEVKKTLKIAHKLEKATLKERKTYSFFLRYHQLKNRTNIVARTDKAVATNIRTLLSKCKPAIDKKSLLESEYT